VPLLDYKPRAVREEIRLTGCITGREVLRHPVAIVRGFGARCYLRCLAAIVLRRRTTFLDCVYRQ
jgi:hypothetical protein